MRIPIYGKVPPAATVNVFLTDGVTAASVYAASVGGAAVASVTADSYGTVVFYYDDLVYPMTFFFDVQVVASGYADRWVRDVWNFFDATSSSTALGGASELDIANDALALLGANAITSLNENSDAARACNRLYAITRDDVLRAYPWNCAMVYTTLTVDATAPDWGFSYRYALPNDCLRVLQLSNNNYRFKVVGRYIHTSDVSDELEVLYITRLLDPSTWDPLLRAAVTARLAADLAIPVKGSQATQKSMWELSALKIREARGVDGQEGSTDTFESNDFTSVR